MSFSKLWIIVAVFAVDRATKCLAQAWLYPRSPVELLPFFYLTYLENTGAAFGILRGANTILIGVSIVLLLFLARLSRRWPAEDCLSHWGITLVAGGAMGNLYDRILRGFVVDFLDFRVWPVFNVADSCITVGAILLAWGLHRREKINAS